MKYGDEVIIESNIVTQFLADGFSARDGHKLQPTTGTPEAALTIARQFFFIDTFVAKVASQLFKVGLAETEDAKRTVTDDIISSVKNELTPLLKGTAEGKFFGGSEHPTLVEVNTGSFLLRLYEFADTGYFPKGWKEELEGTGVFHEWAQRVTALPSVRGIWNKENVLKAQERKLKVLREKQQQAK